MGKKIRNKLKKLFTPTERTDRSTFVSLNSLSWSYFNNSQLIQELHNNEMLSYGIVSKAIQTIASDVARVKFRHYKINKTTHKYDEIYSEISILLNTKPNEKMTGFEFKKILIWNLFIHGKAYIAKIYEDFKLKQLIPLLPSAVSLKIDEITKEEYYEVQAIEQDEKFKFNLNEIIEINYELIQGFQDVKFTTLFKSSLTKMKANELNLINALKHDVSYSLVVKIDNNADEESKKQALESIESMIKLHHEKGVAALIIDNRWEVADGVNIGGSKIDTKLRNLTAVEVASMFGIPPQKLGIETTNTYDTFGELTKSYIDTSLVPLLNNITAKISNNLLATKIADEEIKYSVKDLLSLDPKAIQEYAASAINNGWATPNEIRELAGYENKEEGDDLLINSTLIKLKNQEQIHANKQQSYKGGEDG